MGIREREAKRTGVVGSLIAVPTQTGRETEKIQRAYYLDPGVVKKLKITAAEKGLSASKIVEDALREYLEVDS